MAVVVCDRHDIGPCLSIQPLDHEPVSKMLLLFGMPSVITCHWSVHDNPGEVVCHIHPRNESLSALFWWLATVLCSDVVARKQTWLWLIIIKSIILLLMILGVMISDCLSVNQHITNVIASSAQKMHRRFTLYGSFELMDWTKTHSVEFSRRLLKRDWRMRAPPGGDSPRSMTGRKCSLLPTVECVSASAPPTRLL